MKKSGVMKSVSFWLLFLGIFTALIGTAFAAGGPRAVTVDAGKVVGHIRSLQGAHWDPGPDGQTLSNNYVEMGVDMIRTHDAGGISTPYTAIAGEGDIDGLGAAVIFPDLNADPNNPASYNFGPTDKLIKNIKDTGSEVYFRVGRSNIYGFANNYVPPDINKYGEIVKHVVMHYNKGWAKGFHYGIRYFEIWNEPDFMPFWGGTAAQYYDLYKKVALAIQSVDNHAKIGGPANTTHNDYTGFEGSLLQFIRDNHLPMDFYSFHLYTNQSQNPVDYARYGQRYRAMLDSYGFKRAEIICSEWNTALDGTPLIGGSAAQAVFVAEALMNMQDSPVDQAHYYWFAPPLPTLGKDHNAFAMVSSLNGTPDRLKVTGDDDQGFSVMAGKDEGERELRVLIADYEISPHNMGPIPGGNDTVIFIPGLGLLGTMTVLDRLTYTYQNTNGYNLEIKNIPEGWGDLTVEQYRIDNDKNMVLVGTQTIEKKDRKHKGKSESVKVSGVWVPGGATIVYNPPPPIGDGAFSYVADPAPGAAPGIDMIVVYGEDNHHRGGCHGSNR